MIWTTSLNLKDWYRFQIRIWARPVSRDYLQFSTGMWEIRLQGKFVVGSISLSEATSHHRTSLSSRFSAEKFPEILMEEQSVLASRDSACYSSIEERAGIVMREAFDRLDKEFCSLCTKDGRDWDCGSTALVALIVDDVVSLANLGDCRGVVCRLVSDGMRIKETDGWELLDGIGNGQDPVWDRANGGGDVPIAPSGRHILWKEVTKTHSPLFDEELARIEKANGWIIRETEIPIGQLHRMDIFDKDVVDLVRAYWDSLRQWKEAHIGNLPLMLPDNAGNREPYDPAIRWYGRPES